MDSTLFNELLESLEEVKLHIEGKITLKTTTISITPVSQFSPQEIRTLRNNLNLSQTVFSELLGVTKKSIEAWENGRAVPSGAVRRMLGMLKKNPNLFIEQEILV